MSEAITAAIVPNIKETPSPPKTASLARSVEAKMIAAAVRKMGFALVAAAYAIAFFLSIPLSTMSDLVKSINSRELRELIPMRAINPISEVAVRKKVSAVIKFIIK